MDTIKRDELLQFLQRKFTESTEKYEKAFDKAGRSEMGSIEMRSSINDIIEQTAIMGIINEMRGYFGI